MRSYLRNEALGWGDARVDLVFEALLMQDVPALLWNRRRKAGERRSTGAGGRRRIGEWEMRGSGEW